MKNDLAHQPPHSAPSRQRGAVLIYTLIALVIMLIASAVLVRSFNSSLFNAGNIAFKRDMQNQSELAVNTVLTSLRTGGALAAAVTRESTLKAANYSAAMLPVNAQGIPLALENKAAFEDVAVASNDITSSDGTIVIRYVIDRLCNAVGNESTLGASGCLLSEDLKPTGVSTDEWQGAAQALVSGGAGGSVAAVAVKAVVYRLSVRATGPRGTQSFFQSTFTVPSPT
jgi:type IV pilus assembly protein PilX